MDDIEIRVERVEPDEFYRGFILDAPRHLYETSFRPLARWPRVFGQKWGYLAPVAHPELLPAEISYSTDWMEGEVLPRQEPEPIVAVLHEKPFLLRWDEAAQEISATDALGLLQTNNLHRIELYGGLVRFFTVDMRRLEHHFSTAQYDFWLGALDRFYDSYMDAPFGWARTEEILSGD